LYIAKKKPGKVKMWQAYSEVCEYVPVGEIAESKELFSEFTPL